MEMLKVGEKGPVRANNMRSRTAAMVVKTRRNAEGATNDDTRKGAPSSPRQRKKAFPDGKYIKRRSIYASQLAADGRASFAKYIETRSAAPEERANRGGKAREGGWNGALGMDRRGGHLRT